VVTTARPRDRRDPAEIDDLNGLRSAASACTGCGLYRDATQTVFGDGPAGASVVMVGEQPGDREDLAGEPFVGPAGTLLDRALREAGIPRDEVYLTNVVKHFKFEPRGKLRIHQRPTVGQIRACRPWLDAELRVIRPKLVVTLGATAARALLGGARRSTGRRGCVLSPRFTRRRCCARPMTAGRRRSPSWSTTWRPPRQGREHDYREGGGRA
jgi:DNA polymerase